MVSSAGLSSSMIFRPVSSETRIPPSSKREIVETLMMIVEFLKGLNVPRKDWLGFKTAHLYDLLLSDSRLS